MNKFLKNFVLSILCLALSFTFACNEKSSGGESEEKPFVAFDIWSKSSAVNVMRDVIYDDAFKGERKIEVSGGKGEYEASQLMITASSDKAIKEYTLETADLKCGENIIKKEYVEVYNEKYIEVVSTPAQYSSGLGWYADALLPLNVAVEYGENKVSEGQNQGLYVEVFIPRDVAAGIYTSTFTLTVDGEKYDIPVSVTVYDFEVSKESHLQTDWIVNLTGFGELDTTSEMEYIYFEAVAGYRASTHSMKMGAADADEWLDTVRIYTNPNLRDENGEPLIGEKEFYLAQINLPSGYDGTKAPAGGISYSIFDSYISRLIVASLEDNYDYLSKAGCYMGFIDEPQFNNTWDKVNSVSADFENRKSFWVSVLDGGDLDTVAAKAELDEEEKSSLQNAFDSSSVDFKNALKQSMSLVGNYITSTMDDRLDPSVSRQFCLSTSTLNTKKAQAELENWTDENISGNWWYAAGESFFGNRLDSPRLEQRLSQWFTYESGLKGYLIWETAQYQQIVWNNAVGANSYEPCDAYSLAKRISNAAGDGYVFYPGKPYNIEGPVGSVRAHQYRDSSEEYEYFYLLEELYSSAGYDADEVLSKIFLTLFNNNRVTEDEELFAWQREQVVNLILLAQKGIFVEDYNEFNALAEMSVVSVDGEKIVSVNGEPVNTTAAEITLDKKQAGGIMNFVTETGSEFSLFVGNKAELLYDAQSVAEVRGGVYEQENFDDLSAAKFTFTVDEDVAESKRNYDFTYVADQDGINDETGRLVASFYNPQDAQLFVECWFVGTDGRTVFVDDIVMEKGYNVFTIPRLDLVRWSVIRKITGIRFKVALIEGAAETSLYFINIYAEKEGGEVA